MMRLAWFTPLSPARSGLAAHSAGLLSRLAADFEVDVYVDKADPATLAPGMQPPVTVRPAHDFPWRRARRPYDLTVYDLANAAGHDHAWGYVVRHPGLVVLHDVVLHHVRAAQLLRRARLEDYRAELRFDRPDRAPDVCEIARAPIPHVLAEWPLLGPVVHAARLTVVLDADAAADLRRRYPRARVDAVRFGAADPCADRPAPAAAGAGPVVFVACAPTAAVRRLDLILDAFAALPARPPSRLRVLGPTAEPGVAQARIDTRGLAGRVTLEPDAEPDAVLRAADICLCLGWPPAGETTPLWIRCLAAGRPTIVGPRPRPHAAPLLDPRTWRPRHGGREDGVAVSVDALDEFDTLVLAMRRLATDPARRAALGRRGRRYWERAFGMAAMADDYRRVIRAAAALPAPCPDDLPSHLRADGLEHARDITGRMGVTVDILGGAGAP